MRAIPRRILIVRPSALGDVCRTVPLAWSLRGSFPSASVDWVVEDRWVDAVRGHPAVDRVIPFPKRAFRKWWRSPATALKVARWFAALRRGRYDLVIDAQGLARSGLMALVSGARARIAHRGSREFAWLGANTLVSKLPGAHVVDGMLQLVAAAGAEPRADMRLEVSAAGSREWNALAATLGVRPGTTLVIAATNSWQGKRWPDARWGELVRTTGGELRSAGISDLLLLGAPGEESQTAPLAAVLRELGVLRVHDLAGGLSVAGTVAAIRDARLLVGLDSAPLHIALGVGVPFVGLYGATRPSVDGPYHGAQWCVHGGAGEVLGAHDHRDARLGGALMDRVQVDAVAALVLRRLRHAEAAA